MSITLELTQQHFQDLCKKFDSTKNMSYDATQAIFEYYDDMSEDLGETIEFDISMVWEWHEYTFEELHSDYSNLFEALPSDYDFDIYSEYEEESLAILQDYTQVIELSNGNYLVMGF